jgi:hypothetical protein
MVENPIYKDPLHEMPGHLSFAPPNTFNEKKLYGR